MGVLIGSDVRPVDASKVTELTIEYTISYLLLFKEY